MNGQHKLVLLRHAQSLWNLENRFSGWADIDLSEHGVDEARRAGRLLEAHGFTFDEAYASRLTRAIRTLMIVLDELGLLWIPVFKSWQLNERHYGALEGADKAEVAARFGAEQVHRWRRGFHDRVEALDLDDARHPRFDRRYADVDPQRLPAVESLADTYERVVAYWSAVIAPRVGAGRRILVVSHGNTLRALVKYLDRLSDEAVESLEIPTGRPLVYELADNLKVVDRYFLSDAPGRTVPWSPRTDKVV